ncbi:NAD-dependent succinate-semialdehyde dehydrogenase [Robiginitalea sediminis]|uniref:NAD-dependent succinate-semialdehyde dehydrogenase n=1 Tax=Robiginitalea sediminis TaxID=1982593 RepID=UPI000B4ADCF0|nr:NAD-dependent succinate-semialdehyde dehydrogenase [Robiginitalea sediminis]
MVQSINPYTSEVLYEFEPLKPGAIRRCIETSAVSFRDWAVRPLKDRRAHMERVADVLQANRELYARNITMEVGKPISQSLAEIDKCAWVCRYYANMAGAHLAGREVQTDASRSYVSYEPLGPVLAVMPWNYPFWQVMRFAAPTLMAGNTGLLKHASNVWKCAELIEEAFLEAGFPKGVFQNLKIGSPEVEIVLSHREVRAVSLTGSTAAGSAVGALAGKHIKKSVLELGGSNALIVFEDADLEQTLETCIQARFQNTGQSCIAGKRLLLQRSVSETFLSKLQKRIEALRCGDPLDPETFIGVLARASGAKELALQLEKSLDMGAELLRGGGSEGAFFEPTLVGNVSPEMPLFQEETFGPLLAVTLFDTEEEAAALSNNTLFGLGVSVFTSSMDRARRLIPKLNEGAVFINALVKSDPRLPFGGVGQSGYGRELSEEGIREFTNCKTVYYS